MNYNFNDIISLLILLGYLIFSCNLMISDSFMQV